MEDVKTKNVESPKDDAAEEKAKTKVKVSKTERKKYRVITRLIEGEINGTKAAKMLGITTRQVRNLKRQVLDQGKEGVIHKNKYYKPYNTYDPEISEFICKLYRKEYRGTNFSEYARIIQEQYHIDASRSTIYNFLRRGRIRSPQRKKKKRTVKAEVVNATSTPDTKQVTVTEKKTTKKKASN